jgi:hypothetical protein
LTRFVQFRRFRVVLAVGLCVSPMTCVGAASPAADAASQRGPSSDAATLVQVKGGSAEQRRRLSQLARRLGPKSFRSVEIRSPPTSRHATSRWLYIVVRKSSDAGSTESRWAALMVASAFRDARWKTKGPAVSGFTISVFRSAQIDRIHQGYPQSPRVDRKPASRDALSRLLVSLEARSNIEIVHTRFVRTFDRPAVMAFASIAHPENYLVPFAEIRSIEERAPRIGQGTLLELTTPPGTIVARVGTAPRLGLYVGWVDPDLL